MFTSSSCRVSSSSCEISPLLLRDDDDADAGGWPASELAGVRTPSLSRFDDGMPEGIPSGGYTSAAVAVRALLLLLLLLLSPAAPSPISDGVAPRCRREPADGGGAGEGRPALPLASGVGDIISAVLRTALSTSRPSTAELVFLLLLRCCSSSCLQAALLSPCCCCLVCALHRVQLFFHGQVDRETGNAQNWPWQEIRQPAGQASSVQAKRGRRRQDSRDGYNETLCICCHGHAAWTNTLASMQACTGRGVEYKEVRVQPRRHQIKAPIPDHAGWRHTGRTGDLAGKEGPKREVYFHPFSLDV